MTQVLFVCLGNICRSPTAEGVFRRMVEEAGLADRITIDSAGTGSWHIGEPADHRMQAAARQKGYELTSLARQVTVEDFHRFDHVIAMDESNVRNLRAMCPPEHEHKIRLFRQGESDLNVPDPYLGGEDGFLEVVEIVERSCRKLLREFTT